MDHDPWGTDAWVYFERLSADLDYANDRAALYLPWHIMAVPTTAEGTERQLTHGPWVDWLPVGDPSGRYLLHLRNCGGTEARLIDMQGHDFGRFITHTTAIGYIDWKPRRDHNG